MPPSPSASSSALRLSPPPPPPPPPLLLLLLLGLAARPASAQAYTGPFTRLTASFLDVADPADGFGPEDKLNACNNDLVFIDLDEVGGVWFRYTTATGVWTKGAIGQSGPQCAGQPLYPRTAGYSVGLTKSDTLTDRLLVLGGAAGENNVYYVSPARTP